MGNTSNEMLDRFYLTRHFSHKKREDLHDKVFGDCYEKNRKVGK